MTSSSDTWNVKEFKIVSKDEEELTDTEDNVSNFVSSSLLLLLLSSSFVIHVV